ncbi:MAG: pseudouridine synthase [Christensenellales bacterium]|jgi:23S rRNA pseudouridine2605 synthase
MIRLNKFLAQAGIASRRKCDQLILEGKVKVNDKVETGLGRVINEFKDAVFFDGKRVELQKNFLYFKMNKPKGYVCTNKDDKGRKTVFDLIKHSERLFTIGRLDYDTEGLLLFTNDGELAEKLSHPRNEVKKTYIAKIEGVIKESELAVLRKGVVIDGEVLPSAKVDVYEVAKGYTKLKIIIDEGKNHQIKNMFKGIGRTLMFLKRIEVGGVKLGGLSRGEYKALTDVEVNILKTL